jgi:hypothetical protein
VLERKEVAEDKKEFTWGETARGGRGGRGIKTLGQ